MFKLQVFKSRGVRLAAGLAVVVTAGGVLSGVADGKATSATTFTGAPLTIYAIAPVNTALGSVPQDLSGVKAAVLTINKAGGLDHHKLLVQTCNDTDPNAELSCAQAAVSGKALAFDGAITLLNGTAFDAALEGANVPSVAPVIVPGQYTSPIVFPVDSPNSSFESCMPLVPKVTGKTKIGILSENLGIQLATDTELQAEAKVVGADYVGIATVPVTTTDFTSAAQQLASDGAQIVITETEPQAIPAFIQAAQSLGDSFTYCAIDSTTPLDTLAALGASADNFYMGASLPPASTAAKYPLVKKYVAAMKAEQASGDANATITTGTPSMAFRAWLGIQVIKQAAALVKGPLTGASLLAALRQTTFNSGGVIPTIDFAHPGPVSAFRRIFNPEEILLKWDPSTKQLVPTNTKPINSLTALGL